MRRATKLHLKRNLRRLTGGGLAILILATLLFVLRLIWGYQAERQFTATRAALIADGVRLHIDRPAVADADNAALAVMDALNAIQLTDAEKKLLYSLNYDDIIDNTRTDEQRRELREILARNAPVFAALRVAATRKHVQWPDAKDTVWVWNAGGKFHDVRGLYHLLCISAMLAHETGDGAAALDDLHLLLVLADVADQDLNLIAHLVAARCRNLVAWVVERIVPELDLSQPAAMEAAVRLLRGLQPSPHYLDAPAIAWEIQVEYLTEYWLEKYGPSYSWWLHPLTLNGTARMLEKQRTIGVPAMRADNYQACYALIRKGDRPIRSSRLSETIFNIPNHTNAGERGVASLHFRALSDSAAASLLLAARIFETKHSFVPRESGELVPEILAAVPVDPYSADHRPMRYRLDPGGPTVWSVGENGTDDGGSVFIHPTRSERRRYATSTNPADNPPDIVYGAAWRSAAP